MEGLNKHFSFPFESHGFQVKSKAEIVSRDMSLLKYSVGLGKTHCSTISALQYSLTDGVEQIWVICPPILLDQWYNYLSSIKGIPSICLYRGTPKEREEMNLSESVILVSYNIFRGKKDHGKFVKAARRHKLCIIADELSLKNLRSQTYRKLKQLLYRKLRLRSDDKPFHKLIALTATPLSDLSQTYNWCSLFVPGLYTSKKAFEFVHVEKSDHWGNVEEWKNEDLMKSNMNLFSVDTDETIELPPLVETVTPYDLTPQHMKLYREVEEAEFNNLPEDKIELALNSMFTTLQRLILVPKEFGLDIKPPILDFMEGYLDQLGDGGVLIYTRHVMVSKMMAEWVPNCAAIYGGVAKKVREEAFEDLKSGRKSRLVGNMDSLGVGLQLEFLNHIVSVELPFRYDKMIQMVGRIHRQGQKDTCFVSLPIAKNTIQYQIYHKLLKNEKDLSKVVKTKEQVREFLS